MEKIINLANNGKYKKATILLILLLSSFIFRAPTFFNDYYDVDELSAIVQAKEYFSGAEPNVDFVESKLPVYHLIFKASYWASMEHGYVFVHMITAFIIFLTAVFIFLVGKEIRGENEGFIGGLLYTVLISSFNRHFMATNGEIVYNLPITASFYFLILSLSKEKTLLQRAFYLVIMLIFSAIAANVKFHGIITVLFIVFLIILYYPYIKLKNSKKYFLYILSLFLSFLSILIIDFFTLQKIYHFLDEKFYGKIFYSLLSRGINPLNFIGKYLHHQAYLSLWHITAWVPASIVLYKFIKNRFLDNDIRISVLFLFFLCTYMINFSGGERLYFHYFMTCYPSLCIISGIFLLENGHSFIQLIRRKFVLFIMIPGIFFLGWNIKDIIIKHYCPETFYNESKAQYWFRALVVASFNDYLLPDNSYKEVCEYVKNHTASNDRIFVWGNGAYIYYFSNRLTGSYTMWNQERINRIIKTYKNPNISKKEAYKFEEKILMDIIREKKPELIIDTSKSDMVKTTKFTSDFNDAELFQDYLKKNYKYETTVSKMPIYRKSENF